HREFAGVDNGLADEFGEDRGVAAGRVIGGEVHHGDGRIRGRRRTGDEREQEQELQGVAHGCNPTRSARLFQRGSGRDGAQADTRAVAIPGPYLLSFFEGKESTTCTIDSPNGPARPSRMRARKPSGWITITSARSTFSWASSA